MWLRTKTRMKCLTLTTLLAQFSKTLAKFGQQNRTLLKMDLEFVYDQHN